MTASGFLHLLTCLAVGVSVCVWCGAVFVCGGEQRRHLSEYLAEITIQEFPYLNYKPSQIAASAVCLALHTVSVRSAWSVRAIRGVFCV